MRYLRTFLRHWYFYLIPLIILPAVLTAYGYEHLLLYTSKALIYVQKPAYLTDAQLGWNQYLSPAQNMVMGVDELLQSPSYVAQVAARTSLAQHVDLSTLAGQSYAFTRIAYEISVQATGIGPNTVAVSASDKDPVFAQQIAKAVLEQYNSYYQTNGLSDDKKAIAFFQTQLQAAQSQLAQDTLKLQEYYQQHPECAPPATCTDPAVSQLQQTVSQDQAPIDNYRSQLASLQEDIQALNTSSDQLFQVMDPPQVPKYPALSKTKLVETYTGGGLVVALAIVALFVVGLTQLDRKVYSTADLRVIEEDMELDLPAIDALPLIADMKRRRSGDGDSDVDGLDDILLPVLTALPRLQPRLMQRELWRAANPHQAALSQAAPASMDGEYTP